MYCRTPRVIQPCPTSPTAVPYKSYFHKSSKSQAFGLIIQIAYLYSHSSLYPARFLIKQKVYSKIKKSPSDVYLLFQISVTFISDICQLRLRYLSVAIQISQQTATLQSCFFSRKIYLFPTVPILMYINMREMKTMRYCLL